MAKKSEPILTVSLMRGLADRKRLPLAHVIGVLDELRQLITEIGRDVQRKSGAPNPTGDFGLELVAGEKGVSFKPGSVQAHIAVTERTATGLKAIRSVIETVGLLNSEDFPERSSDKSIDRRIVRRLSRIAKIQKADHTELLLSIDQPGDRTMSATFGSSGIAAVRSIQAPTFRVHGTVLYGRLYQLLDRSTAREDLEDGGFWGELRTDHGELWRVQFQASDAPKVTPLFRKEVRVTGVAVHYRLAHPKLICESIQAETQKDYEKAYDELFGCDKDAYRADLQAVLNTLHGEE
jgi:hypothetical protein